MQYYETHFEEYVRAVEKCNLHPELLPVFDQEPECMQAPGNILFYGPSGVGKYSQVLYFLRRRCGLGGGLEDTQPHYYERKLTVPDASKDTPFAFRMSNIHFEVDMGLLGCNSKQLWHELHLQIVDIVTMRADKCGIVVCKNFHCVHSDLLEIFHSYVESPRFMYPHLHLRYILISEHLSFIPPNVLSTMRRIVHVARPSLEAYAQVFNTFSPPLLSSLLRLSDMQSIKEMRGINKEKEGQVPDDVFTIVCNDIVDELRRFQKKPDVGSLREKLYEILVYQLDVGDCIWYVLEAFLHNPQWFQANAIDNTRVSTFVQSLFPFFKYYNNNYRPIYHLERVFLDLAAILQ